MTGTPSRPWPAGGASSTYTAFVKGEGLRGADALRHGLMALNGAKTYYEEKHAKATFVQNVISDKTFCKRDI